MPPMAYCDKELHRIGLFKQPRYWNAHDLLTRRTTISIGSLLVQRRQTEVQTVADCAEEYRQRLASPSRFMKCLNEPIARQANREDKCTGHFWESRFKSQALRTEEALLSCMTYVDLNPVRTGMADTPEASDYTSIKERLTPCFNLKDAIADQVQQGCLQAFNLPLKPLLHFEGNVTEHAQHGLPFNLQDYLELVDFTGRAIHTGKRGIIAAQLPPILHRLDLDQRDWLARATQFETHYRHPFGQRTFNDTA